MATRAKRTKWATWQDRFWSKVDCSGGAKACWLWTAGQNGNGYGYFHLNGRHVLAHRVAYELLVGPLPQWNGHKPPEIQLDHICRVRHCVNPAHLELVTSSENVRRGKLPEKTEKRNAAVTHCPKGHEYTPANTRVAWQLAGGRMVHSRKCRECHRASEYKRKAAKRTPTESGTLL